MTYPITSAAIGVLAAVHAAKPGDNFTVRLSVGTGHTQTLILACAVRDTVRSPLVISPLHSIVRSELNRLQRTGVAEILAQAGSATLARAGSVPIRVPKFVIIQHPVSVTFDRLCSCAPELVIVHRPPLRAARWTKALAEYVGKHPNVIVVGFES